MQSKPADLFGTFLDTLTSATGPSRGVAARRLGFDRGLGGGRTTEGNPTFQGPSSPQVSQIAEAVMKRLADHPREQLPIQDLMDYPGVPLSLLLDAVGQLQSYGLIENSAGRISLSESGADLTPRS